jgi:hypothetical protein
MLHVLVRQSRELVAATTADGEGGFRHVDGLKVVKWCSEQYLIGENLLERCRLIKYQGLWDLTIEAGCE